ncbi:MAG TPA: hypothetical protein VF472_23065 [Burkholderiaceae bacterium]
MSKLTIRDGSSQGQRLLPALADGYFKVDETRFEDLLLLASELAGHLQYRDARNRPDGNWRAFFDSDEACILAAILATNAQKFTAEFSALLVTQEEVFTRLRDGDLRAADLPAFMIAAKLDSWYAKLGRLSSVAAMRAQANIREQIEKVLRVELRRLRLFLRLFPRSGAEAAFKALGTVWEIRDESTASAAMLPPSLTQKAALQFLKANFHFFHQALLLLQKESRDILTLSLARSDHDPSMGLFLSFLTLFQRVQGKINEFTNRHLHFYYRDVLKTERRDFLPDSTWLLFSADTAGREVRIAKGTEFRAGLDENGVELLYAADNDLLVSDAEVASLHTLYFVRDPLSSPENGLFVEPEGSGLAQQFATATKRNKIDNIVPGSAAATLPSYPLFGVPRSTKSEDSFETARLGFAVASGVLLLKNGLRDIKLTFKLSADSPMGDPASFVTRLADVLGTTPVDAFFKAFRSMFNIALTGESGWIEVDEYLPSAGVVDPKEGEDSFTVQFRLSDGAGSVVPYKPDVHGDNFDTDQPIVKFTINPNGYLYPYSLLSEWVVRDIAIEVDVRGMTNVQLYNQHGPLNADVQFAPFGPAPAYGDFFIIGNHEAASKKLVDFEADIRWSGLPQDANGFAEYYRAYPSRIDNTTFKVKLSALRDRQWLPADTEAQPQAALFRSAKNGGGNGNNGNGGSGKPSRQSRISFRGLCAGLKPMERIPESRYKYDAMAKDGFFKLTLAAPADPFGHKSYPLLLSKVMADNARLERFGLTKLFTRALPPRPLPNPPYTPTINAISLNYRAVGKIGLEHVASGYEAQRGDKFFHLHPSGVESISHDDASHIHLVPQYKNDGNLVIGISASKLSGLLTLFFHLREDSQPEAGSTEFAFDWFYLASNRWKPFGKSQVISDSTNGFLSSGIVTLDVPEDIDRNNTILPDNLYWIRVSSNGRPLDTLCSLYGVHTQALRASWRRQPGNSMSHLTEPLPAGRIKEARVSIPGLGSVHQIMSTFGGTPPEDEKQWTIRVSERLRHKNRAVTPEDYESIILQQFPEIYKVKCFPCMRDDEAHWRQTAPGHILIVLIPYLKEIAASNMKPKVNALLLKEVRQFVGGLASPFTAIKVRNPAYEQIQVRCKVKFKAGAGKGFHLNKINQDIVDYFSPWSKRGLDARFGWQIRCNDVQSHIQRLDFVDSVSGLSMLRIVESDDRRSYRLTDTRREESNDIRPIHPWSIAIPFNNHLIEVVDDRRYHSAENTGIDSLAIGGTFIPTRRDV